MTETIHQSQIGLSQAYDVASPVASTDPGTSGEGTSESTGNDSGFAPCRSCSSCGGSAHPASGCEYSPTMLICGRCVRLAWRWILGHTELKKRVGPKRKNAVYVSFYHAASLNRPKDLGV